MPLISDFLKQGLAALQGAADADSYPLTWGAVVLPCIFDTATEAEELDFGGKNPVNTRVRLMAATSDFPDATRPKLGEVVTFLGQSWKVQSTINGAVTVQIEIYAESRRGG